MTQLKIIDGFDLSTVPYAIRAEAAFDLKAAFELFFRRINKFPKFQSYRPGYAVMYNGIKLDGKRIRHPKLGWVRTMEQWRYEQPPTRYAMTKRLGRWYAVLSTTLPSPDAKYIQRVGGLDVGIGAYCAMDSDGHCYENPINSESVKYAKMRLRRTKSKRLQRKYQRRVDNLVKQSFCEIANALAAKYDLICVESAFFTARDDLSPALKRARLAELLVRIKITFENHGKQVIIAPKNFASTQLCSNCGEKVGPTEITVREWMCVVCGTTHDRDHNAAQNLGIYASQTLGLLSDRGRSSGK